jgi:hypothetical protein
VFSRAETHGESRAARRFSGTVSVFMLEAHRIFEKRSLSHAGIHISKERWLCNFVKCALGVIFDTLIPAFLPDVCHCTLGKR